MNRYVVLGMWKCGSKTMHEVFASLGCKVFDAHHMMDFADQVAAVQQKRPILNEFYIYSELRCMSFRRLFLYLAEQVWKGRDRLSRIGKSLGGKRI